MQHRFEDLKIWQKSKDLAKSIYMQFSGIKDFGFKDQIQRAAVSVMNNIAEGAERNSSLEFQHFLFIAKGSCGEVLSPEHVFGRVQARMNYAYMLQNMPKGC